jgi:hypothetical protein
MISPQQGYVNTLLTVSGEGWWPGEPVFVFLRSPREGEGPGYAYAAAVVDDWGRFRTGLTFPNEARWIGEQMASVIARGSRSGLEAATSFSLVAPTATNTVPPPTLRPTVERTQSPWPTATGTATPTPSPTPTATMLNIADWRGEYFASAMLAGEPVLVRNDERIDFNWGAASPDPRIPADGFSARWTRQQSLSAGYYRFTVMADDGVRFWIDGELVVDEWHDGLGTPYTFDAYAFGGQHPMRLEYYENAGGAMVRLTWTQIEPPTQTPSPTTTRTPTPTPSSTHTPLPTATSTPSPTSKPTEIVPTIEPPSRPLPASWLAEYYPNRFLGGLAVVVREDAEVNFDWGTGSPDPSIAPDDFSARWAGSVLLPAGNYRYTLSVDDGARLWIDGQLVIDEWHRPTSELYVIEVGLDAGTHTFQVEYFEETESAYVHLTGEPAWGSSSAPLP